MKPKRTRQSWQRNCVNAALRPSPARDLRAFYGTTNQRFRQ